MSRPHPIVWRLVKGTQILYLIGCVWMLFQSPEDARGVYQYVDPKLGVPIVRSKDHAADCRIYTPEKESKFANVRVLF